MQITVRHNLQLFDAEDTSPRDEAAIVLPVREADAVMGETVEAYLARVAWRFDLPTVCRINGEFYGRAEWAARHLALNDNVEFVSRPMGGGGSGGSTAKSIISIVSMIALTALAPYAIAGLGLAALGTTAASLTLLGKIAAAVIVGAGALAISHFLTPKAGGKTDKKDDLYQFGFGGSQARPMQPIPVLNGRMRFAPDYGAPTYSEFNGDAMTDYALYALTCGRMRLEQILIGDTPIWDYQNGFAPEWAGIEMQFVEPGEQVTLYPVNVVTADELNGVQLSREFTPGYIVNAAGTSAKELLLDFVWSGGAYVTYKDRTLSANTDIAVEARTVNAAGAATGPWVQIFRNVYSQNKQSQIRVTERVTVPPGRYEVRARRQNPSVEDSGVAKISGTDEVTWTALRAHIDGPNTFPRVTMLALKGVASEKLSGVSGGGVKVIGTRILPVWRDGQFVEEPTRSIAWAALDWWRNGDYAAGLSLSNIDFAAFLAYDRLWSDLGHTFDYRFTEVQNLDDVLETVLRAGRAIPSPVGDKLTITRDQPRGLPRMLFTDNDIVRDSLEIDYALSDESWADGIVGEYVDETTWRLAEITSAPDGVTLLKPARVQLDGIVQRTQAAGAIRQMAAESQYRRITVSWIARMEGRLLKRGDLVKITTEEPESWGSSHEVVASINNGFGLTLDPAPDWTISGTHWIEIRQRDGRPFGPVRVMRGATDANLTINGSDAASAAAAASAQYGYPVSLADAVARSDSQEPPWVAFSPGEPRSFPVLITSGDPDQDGEHIHLSGVLDAPEVYQTTEAGVTPLLQVPDLYSGAMPVITFLTASISQRQATLVLTGGWLPARNAATYDWAISYDGGMTWVAGQPTDRTSVEAVVGASDNMKFRVRGVTPGGVPGGWSVTDVIAPDLQIPSDLFADLTFGIEKLSEETQREIRSINDAGSGLLAEGVALTADYLAAAKMLQAQGRNLIQEGEDATTAALRFAREVLAAVRERSRGGVDLAGDAIRGILKQHDDALARLGDEAATQTGDAYQQRQLTKVQVDKSFAALERESVARVREDEVLASATTTLAVRLDVAEGGIVGNATAIQGVSSRVTATENGLVAQSQQTTTLSARIDANDFAISGQANATQLLTTRVTLTEKNIVSISEFTTALDARVSTHDGQISGQATAIDTLTTRASAIDDRVTSEASRTTALEAVVSTQGGLIAGNATAIDSVSARTTATEKSVESVAQRTTALETEVSTQGGKISGQATALSQLTSRTSATEDRVDAEASRLDSLSSTVSTQGGQITGNANATDKLSTRVAATENRIESEAARTTALSSRVDTVDGKADANSSAVQQLATRTSAIEGQVVAEAKRTDTLATRVASHDGTLTSQSDNIDDLYSRSFATDDNVSSVASRTSALESAVNDANTGVSATATAVSQLKTEVSKNGTDISSVSSRTDALRSAINDPSTGLSATAAAASQLRTDVSSLDGKVSSSASDITTLQTKVGDNVAQITTLAASYDGVRVQYGVTGFIDGNTGGLVLTGAKSLDGTVTFKLLVSADMFVDGLLTARMMSTTSLITTTAQIGTLTVDSISVKDGAISTPVASQSTGQSASVTINVRTANAVSIIVRRTGDLSSRYQQGTNTGALKIYCDGNYIVGLPADFIFDPDFNLRASYVRLGPCTVPFQYTPGVGTHTFRVEDDNGAGIGGVYIEVKESK